MAERIETPREAALRRVMEQERRVARQKETITRLGANGIAPGQAERLLAAMEESLRLLRAALKLHPEDSN